jgi:hypothetical protein
LPGELKMSQVNEGTYCTLGIKLLRPNSAVVYTVVVLKGVKTLGSIPLSGKFLSGELECPE